MKDDAVAPVIAVMLVLAALVTFLSIWNAVYVPSMKQSAEVTHLQNVESAFQHFSSDIERAASTRQDDLVLSEPVQLGGGDFIFNTLRSSGSIAVRNEPEPVYLLWLEDDTDIDATPNTAGTLVNISYEPAGNFWQDQGYCWQYGYLNVTKYRTDTTRWSKQAPLKYNNMTDVNAEFNGLGSLAAFAGSFQDVEHTVNQTHFPNFDSNGNVTSYSPRTGNCSSIVLWAVNLLASPDHHIASSNGYGTLQLKSSVTSVPYYGIRNITGNIGSGNEPFGAATFRKWNSSFSDLNTTYCYSNVRIKETHDGVFSHYEIAQDVSPVNITLKTVTIEVGAY